MLMPENDDLVEFYQQIQSEVIERAGGSGGNSEDSDDAEFKENTFTQLVIEYLAEAGVVEDGDVCFYRTKVGNAYIKVSGYFLDDETRRLDLFTSLYHHTTTPETVTKEA